MYLFILALLLLLGLHFWKNKEGYDNYDEPTCLTLAKKNQNNLDTLKQNMDIKKALHIFREENEKNCKILIDLYEVKIERERLDKFMKHFSLQPSSYL